MCKSRLPERLSGQTVKDVNRVDNIFLFCVRNPALAVAGRLPLLPVVLCAILALGSGQALAAGADDGIAVSSVDSPAMATPTGPASVVLSPQDRALLDKIEQELNRQSTFQARIRQVDAAGKIETGTVWMKRPGRMRLVYDPPSPLLLVAAEGKVVFRDNQLDQTTVIPIDRTPLGLLLRAHISLTDDVTVTDFIRDSGLVQVTLVRTSAPGDGSLTLVFREKPLALVAWSVTDAQARQTRVTLSDIHAGVKLADSLFVLPQEQD
ncbi:LolA family protein [Acetobacter peroxydans]|jgi:outer membrane lipoprotein-sorting protein|uniref:LolA family protein n=1 Tax=Acetobacter peroxydans TaxID=104098 RepID=UPI002355D8D5|nr:outer membrane lipoprotein carrier protein LolA [Acetobacter peroxydans]MCH4142494.1 outer membrane lipoprotein carrier protein LolA [Acetobacter peroxydans]MCI1395010.1 outer membrane lipoprotein carrier protein LolA [Acetobacter peroxydans]MCI1410705.1 outer membrane lipoprotein carrier protein LolA [Acetobacter peroxydans]MCI1440265.1 outer membrane lipoprotein carrier protein LolA [Acetobacter peroxydans]MCI1565977.1 outer membrane lipoprotein carrier protein LolA [Acetobacter peroxydan